MAISLCKEHLKIIIRFNSMYFLVQEREQWSFLQAAGGRKQRFFAGYYLLQTLDGQYLLHTEWSCSQENFQVYVSHQFRHSFSGSPFQALAVQRKRTPSPEDASPRFL